MTITVASARDLMILCLAIFKSERILAICSVFENMTTERAVAVRMPEPNPKANFTPMQRPEMIKMTAVRYTIVAKSCLTGVLKLRIEEIFCLIKSNRKKKNSERINMDEKIGTEKRRENRVVGKRSNNAI